MSTRIVADLLIPGRGAPVERGTVILDGASITFAGATAMAPAATSDDTVVEVPVDQLAALGKASNNCFSSVVD